MIQLHFSISITLRFGLWMSNCNTQILFFFSAIQLDLRCCEWNHCPIAWLSLGQTLSITQTASRLIRILWYKENVMVYSITTRCPGSAAAKQNRIIIFCHCATTQNLWHEVFVLIWSVPFHQMLFCALWPDISTLFQSQM